LDATFTTIVNLKFFIKAPNVVSSPSIVRTGIILISNSSTTYPQNPKTPLENILNSKITEIRVYTIRKQQALCTGAAIVVSSSPVWAFRKPQPERPSSGQLSFEFACLCKDPAHISTAVAVAS